MFKLCFALSIVLQLKLTFAIPKRTEMASFKTKKLYVSRVNREITQTEFQEYFGQFGTFTEAVIKTDNGGQSREFGFVTYGENVI